MDMTKEMKKSYEDKKQRYLHAINELKNYRNSKRYKPREIKLVDIDKILSSRGVTLEVLGYTYRLSAILVNGSREYAEQIKDMKERDNFLKDYTTLNGAFSDLDGFDVIEKCVVELENLIKQIDKELGIPNEEIISKLEQIYGWVERSKDLSSCTYLDQINGNLQNFIGKRLEDYGIHYLSKRQVGNRFASATILDYNEFIGFSDLDLFVKYATPFIQLKQVKDSQGLEKGEYSISEFFAGVDSEGNETLRVITREDYLNTIEHLLNEFKEEY